jgi:hypothetical protein
MLFSQRTFFLDIILYRKSEGFVKDDVAIRDMF